MGYTRWQAEFDDGGYGADFWGSNHSIGSGFDWSKEVKHLTVILRSPQQVACCLDKVARTANPKVKLEICDVYVDDVTWSKRQKATGARGERHGRFADQ
jgi:hypothetical protein